MYDRSLVARVHPFQSGQGAIYSPQIGHLRGTLVLFGFDIDKPCENGGHRVIDPDVDRAQFPFGPLGGSLDLPWIRKIYRNREPFRPPLLDLSAGIPKPIGITSQQRDGAPGLANSRTTARPTPAAAPVTTMTSSFITISARVCFAASARDYDPGLPCKQKPCHATTAATWCSLVPAVRAVGSSWHAICPRQ